MKSKKITILTSAILILPFLFVSCIPVITESPREILIFEYEVPAPIEDTGNTEDKETPTATPAATSSKEEYKKFEKQLHDGLGINVIKNTAEISSAYSKYGEGTYERYFQHMVDKAYREFLNLAILRSRGIDISRYEGIFEALKEFFKENEPKNLLPYNLIGTGMNMIFYFAHDVKYFTDSYEEKLVENESFIALYRELIKMNINYYSDVIRNNELLKDVLIPDTPKILSEEFDDELCYIVLDIEHEEGDTVIYDIHDNTRYVEDSRYRVAEDGKVYIPASIEGYVGISIVDKYGVYSSKILYTAQSAVHKIPYEEVNFKSQRLDAAVRKYLGLGSDDIITKRDLAAIESVYISGDTIIFEFDPENLSSSNLAEINDFSFDDIEYFPYLNTLYVENNITGNPSGNSIKFFDTLNLTNCGITDISALEGARIISLYFRSNLISDATVLETVKSLNDIDLSFNTTEKIALPSRKMYSVRIDMTNIFNLDFLESVSGITSFSCRGTPVTDISILKSYPSLNYLAIPEGIDYSMLDIKSLPLYQFYVGEKSMLIFG